MFIFSKVCILQGIDHNATKQLILWLNSKFRNHRWEVFCKSGFSKNLFSSFLQRTYYRSTSRNFANRGTKLFFNCLDEFSGQLFSKISPRSRFWLLRRLLKGWYLRRLHKDVYINCTVQVTTILAKDGQS